MKRAWSYEEGEFLPLDGSHSAQRSVESNKAMVRSRRWTAGQACSPNKWLMPAQQFPSRCDSSVCPGDTEKSLPAFPHGVVDKW